MTPKEKAEELVTKYRDAIISFLSDSMKDANAKRCALIAVDEILNEYWLHDTNRRHWWGGVKLEIEKL